MLNFLCFVTQKLFDQVFDESIGYGSPMDRQERREWTMLSVIFSTIFRHLDANTCRNTELEEDFG